MTNHYRPYHALVFSPLPLIKIPNPKYSSADFRYGGGAKYDDAGTRSGKTRRHDRRSLTTRSGDNNNINNNCRRANEFRTAIGHCTRSIVVPNSGVRRELRPDLPEVDRSRRTVHASGRRRGGNSDARNSAYYIIASLNSDRILILWRLLYYIVVLLERPERVPFFFLGGGEQWSEIDINRRIPMESSPK